MAYAVYTIEITSGNLALESGQETSAVISRTGGTAPPANAYVTSATSIVTSYYCFSTRYPYFTFNNVTGIGTYYGYSDGLPRHYDSVGTDTVPVYMNDAILSVGTSGTYLSLGIQGGGSGRQVGVYAKGTARETIITITVYYDVRTSASTATFDQNVYAGEQITLTLSNDRISALNHRITATLGSYTTSIQTETGVSSGLEIYIPLEWMNAIPNSTQGTGSMEVATYEGSTLIGAVNYTIYILVPDDILPTLGAQTVERIDNAVPVDWGIYVQKKSGVRIEIPNAQGTYGSTINKYGIVGGMTDTKATGTFSLNPIQEAGAVTFTITVTDSRGRTDSKDVEIDVVPYASPLIVNATAERCDSEGNKKEDGTWISALVNATVSSCDGKNGYVFRAQYRKSGEETWQNGANQNKNIASVFGEGMIDIDNAYQVKISISDQFSNVDRILEVGMYAYAIHFKRGGLGVAFGQVSRIDNAVEVAPKWTLMHNGMDAFQVLHALDSGSNLLSNSEIPIVANDQNPNGAISLQGNYQGTFTLSADITKGVSDAATNTRIQCIVSYEDGTRDDFRGTVDYAAAERDGITRRKVLTFTTKADAVVTWLHIYLLSYSTQGETPREAKAERFKLERGNTATAWTPSLKDATAIIGDDYHRINDILQRLERIEEVLSLNAQIN